MKKSVRISLVSICSVLLVICSVALGLYSFGYMGFEDGKLKFYFNKNIDDPDNPDSPDNPDEPTPDEPATKYTLYLVYPDGTQEEYEYDPVKVNFNPSASYTSWISKQEKNGKLYRFDNWYLDENYHDVMLLKNLRDKTKLYAKMVEQVKVTIHGVKPDSDEIKEVVLDKNSIFDMSFYAYSLEACYMATYLDSDMTQEVGSKFLVTKTCDVYALWSTPYIYFSWEFVGQSVILSKYKGSNSSVVIPSSFVSNSKKYSVISIGDKAFLGSQNLKKVTIPSTVTSIGAQVFMGCVSLKDVKLSDSIVSIGESAFEGCTELTSVSIGKSVNNIGAAAFANLPNLTEILVDARNSSFYVFSNCLIQTAEKQLIGVCKGWVIPEDGKVESIGSGAFKNNLELREIVIPNVITKIAGDAFSGCANLLRMSVQDGNPVLYGAGNCIIEIATKTLILGCRGSDLSADNTIVSIGEKAFYSCIGLVQIVIPSNIVNIGYRAFYGCPDLTGIVIGAGVQNIGIEAFLACKELTSIEVDPANTTYHSAGNCIIETATKTLVEGCKASVIPTDDSVCIIGERAFANCVGLTEIVIPANITTIKADAFRDCPDLAAVTFKEGLTSIEGHAFSNCEKLTTVTLPDSLKNIGEYVFSYCVGLSSASFGGGLSYTGVGTFYGCTTLTYMSIPVNIKSISDDTFRNSGLRILFCGPEDPPSLSSTAFLGCSLSTIRVRSSTTSIILVRYKVAWAQYNDIITDR